MKIREKILNSAQVRSAIASLSSAIITHNSKSLSKLSIVGIHTGGVAIAKELKQRLERDAKLKDIPYGELDITLYRDDLATKGHKPVVRGTLIDFDVNGKVVVLVDDVLFTGRTIRAALDQVVDFGRPESVQLAVLVDRGHRELPIQADFTGVKKLTKKEDVVKVRLDADSRVADAVLI